MTMDFTKADRKQMRQLASTVYEAEVHRPLEELDAEFARWCPNSELLSAIHEFHQHQSRELWSSCQSLSDAGFWSAVSVLASSKNCHSSVAS